jgi:hypothetical protein
MEEWLVGCRAATSGMYCAFDDEAPIAVVYYLRGQEYDALALLHEARQEER